MSTPRNALHSRKDILVAAACGVFVAAMVGAAYAAVPLYNWFCRSTGFGGTPQLASAAPGHIVDRTLAIRFDANVAGGLPWRFEPEVDFCQCQSRRSRHGELPGDQPIGSRYDRHCIV